MKSLKLIVLLTFLLTLVNVRGAWALASGLPSDDTYIDVNDPETIWDDNDLEVRASTPSCNATTTVYMQWNVADIPGAATVATATLTLTTTVINNIVSGTTLTLYETGDNWAEETLTATLAPAPGAAITTQPAPTAAGQTVVFSGTALRDYIAAQASGDDKVSFALRLSGTCFDGTTMAVFADRENTTDGGPYLLLLNPNAVKQSALRISGLNAQWPIVGALILGGMTSLVQRRRALRRRKAE